VGEASQRDGRVCAAGRGSLRTGIPAAGTGHPGQLLEDLSAMEIVHKIVLVVVALLGGLEVDFAAGVGAAESPSVESSSSAAVKTPASTYDTPAPNFKDRTGVMVMVLIAVVVWFLVAGVAFVVLRAHHNRKMQEEGGNVENGGKESLDDFLNQTQFSNPLASDDDDTEASTPSLEHLRVGAAADDEALKEIRKLQHELTQSKINEARLQEEVGALRGEASAKSHTSFKGAVLAVEATSTRRRLTRAEPVRSKAKNGSNQLFMLQQGDVVNVLEKKTGKDGVARIKVSLDSKDPANKNRGKHHGKAGWIREKDRKGAIAELVSSAE
jgi:flagellar basal body-associated protein FliL